MELSGWGPLVAMWLGGAVHLMLIVRTERTREVPPKTERGKAA